MGILAGRDKELAVLAEQAATALSGSKTTSVVVVGDPGVGKTTLVDAAVAGLQPERVVRIVGYATERTVPLAAARDLLRLVAEHEDLDDLKGVLTDAAGVSERCYQAVVASAPLLLVVDDLQWLDPLSIGLVHYVIRGVSAADVPLATIVASRASSEASDFIDSIRRALPSESVHVVELAPLSRSAGIAVATSVDPTLDETEATRLWERARGSPFWMRALLQDRGTSSTRDLALRRLRHCSDDASVLASMLALVTRPLSRRDAGEILEWLPERVAEAASELVDRGIAVSEGRIMHLVHDLVRDALTTSIESSLRIDLHRRVGAWLERLGADDPAALVEALAHVRAARENAASLGLRIATAPSRRLLGSEAVQELARVADDLPWASLDRVCLDQAIARLAGELGDQDLALARWTAVLEQAADADTRAEAGLGAARAATALERGPLARRLLDAVRSVISEDSPQHVRTLALDARLTESLDHRPDDARLIIGEAMTLARAWSAESQLAGDAQAAYLDALATAMELTKMDNDEAGLAELAEEAVAVARGVGDQQHLEAVLGRATARYRSDIVSSTEGVRAVWEEANRRVLPTVELEAGYWLARLLRHLGRIVEAYDVAESTRLLSLRVGALSRNRGAIEFTERLVALSSGPWQPALEALADSAEKATDPHFELRLWQFVAQWEARLHGRSAALSVANHVRAALDAAAAAKCSRCGTELLLVAAEALAVVGDAARAAPLLDEWDSKGDASHPYWGLARRRAGALLKLADDGGTAAHDDLVSVLVDSQAMGFGLHALWDGIHLARAQVDFDRAAAAKTLRAVAAQATAGGARTEAAVAEQALRRLGVRTWARQSATVGDDPLGALTEREREIATLIAGGASNPDIAGRLFLSRKTVERHVSNVLAKLGTRNRAQVAALVSQQAAPSGD
ncbi:MAG: LuxR C-terminal-related transcriptional regulator [Actinobacteria bacterium]|nr:LuxR C-terminal-related transcriptional regulator [Actinomycetota bacterium]